MWWYIPLIPVRERRQRKVDLCKFYANQLSILSINRKDPFNFLIFFVNADDKSVLNSS